MINKIIQFIKTKHMILPGEKVLLGISGGPDSMALWEIMQEIAVQMGFELLIAHVNHSLRPEADLEEEYVRNLANSRDIPGYFHKIDVNMLARHNKRSIEDIARQERYAFFYRVLEETGAAHIATAHHKDDVAETVLLHLLRGSGIKGLRGIMPVNGKIIRPLLPVNKKEILEFLSGREIKYFVDQSNYDPLYMRNRIRHELIPILQEGYNPGIVETLNQLADIAGEENAAIEKICAEMWAQALLIKKPERIELAIKALNNLEIAYRRRIILRALAEIGGYEGWNMLDVTKIIESIDKPGSARIIKLKKGIRVNKVYDRIIFTTQTPRTESFAYKLETIPAAIEVSENETRYCFEMIARQDWEPVDGQVYLDYGKLSFPLVIRNRRPGDHFYPQGMAGKKKLKDFFIDNKMPYFSRDKVAVVSSEGSSRVWAVLDCRRIDKEVVVNRSTQTILVIKKCNIVKNNK